MPGTLCCMLSKPVSQAVTQCFTDQQIAGAGRPTVHRSDLGRLRPESVPLFSTPLQGPRAKCHLRAHSSGPDPQMQPLMQEPEQLQESQPAFSPASHPQPPAAIGSSRTQDLLQGSCWEGGEEAVGQGFPSPSCTGLHCGLLRGLTNHLFGFAFCSLPLPPTSLL